MTSGVRLDWRVKMPTSDVPILQFCGWCGRFVELEECFRTSLEHCVFHHHCHLLPDDSVWCLQCGGRGGSCRR
jgi:hypothetical protein